MRTMLSAFVILALLGVLPADAFDLAGPASTPQERCEETGCEPARAADAPAPLPSVTRNVEFLMIPESTGDVIGMYDPYDGTYLGDVITANPGFNTPINAIKGPDGNIYVSDQTADAVFVFDPAGQYLYTYANAADGLDNVRGIAFRAGELFVTCGAGFTARFNGPHSRLPDFINDGTDPFDVHFLPDGSALLADIMGSTDNVRLYDAAGVFQYVLFAVNFPEQISDDPVTPGEFLNASFSANVIKDFDLSGAVHSSLPWSGGRGVYRLGNGNLLATSGTGTFELDAATGVVIEQQHGGSGRFIEPYSMVSGVTPQRERTSLLLGAMPTLCSAEVRVQFALPQAAAIDLGIFDAGGRQVARLANGWADAGPHVLQWNRVASDGNPAPGGVYFVRLRSEDASDVRRIVLAR